MKSFLTKHSDIILLISSVISLFVPLILYLTGDGFQESISTYHNTDAKWVLFGLLIFLSLGFLTGTSRWKISGILLILIAIVNVDFRWPHNIIAGIFFIHITQVILTAKRYSLFGAPIVISSIFWAAGVINLYEFEMIGIICLISFNITYITQKMKYLKYKRKNLET